MELQCPEIVSIPEILKWDRAVKDDIVNLLEMYN
jgi:hypothetical protein